MDGFRGLRALFEPNGNAFGIDDELLRVLAAGYYEPRISRNRPSRFLVAVDGHDAKTAHIFPPVRAKRIFTVKRHSYIKMN